MVESVAFYIAFNLSFIILFVIFTVLKMHNKLTIFIPSSLLYIYKHRVLGKFKLFLKNLRYAIKVFPINKIIDLIIILNFIVQ